MGNLRNENLSLLEQLNLMGGKSKRSIYIDDSLLKGGFRVVNTIEERDAIDCCHRKWGMEVTVVGPDLDFVRYTLRSRKCSDNVWIVSNAGLVSVNETEVDLVEDYSELEPNLENQRDLNMALKRAILELQSNPSHDPTKADLNASNLTPPDVILWRDALDIYSKAEVDAKFLNGSSETAQVKSDWNAVSGPEEILNKPIIPTPIPQVNSDWNSVSGPSEILNKPIIPAPVDISGKMDKIPFPDNTNLKVVLGDNTVRPLETFELGDQIEVTLPATVLSSWVGKVVLFTNSGTLTIPTGLPNSWSFNGATLSGVNMSLSITSPKTWLFGTPYPIVEKQIFTIAQRGATNSIMLFGL